MTLAFFALIGAVMFGWWLRGREERRRRDERWARALDVAYRRHGGSSS